MTLGSTARVHAARWQQQWSAEHKRPYYYDTLTKESVWELPVDAVNVQYMKNIDELKASVAAQKPPEPKVAALAMTILLPVVLVFGALFLLHMYVARYHPELLKEQSSRKKRDRAAKRANRQPGVGKPKQKWKMSQDGKGGRSANS
mmetsp:Transcript_13115/g.34173  ORF Transcript_13115/g.34173 Transcript_13115/m.34173 type:complete len:146 (+) Transcript_13115:185-622(+)